MFKFSRLLSRITNIALVVILLFSIVQLPIYAQENETETGSLIVTESGSVLETQDLGDTSTGTTAFKEKIELNINSGTSIVDSNSGSKLEPEQTGTGEILIEEQQPTETNTGSKVITSGSGSLPTQIQLQNGEEKLEKKQIQIKEERKNKFKRKWSDDDVIKLGYVPGEIVIKFKKDKINLKKLSGKQKAKDLIFQKSSHVAENVIQKTRTKKKEIGVEFDKLNSSDKSSFKKDFLKLKQNLDFANLSVVELGVDEGVKETIEALKNNPEIEYVVPNYVFTFDSVTPNDEYFDNQWALHNTGQTLGTGGNIEGNLATTSGSSVDADIDMFEAWDEVSSTSSVIVAVLDTGVAYNHPDLDGVMWDGSSGCKDENGSTTGATANGCPYYGWDFVNNDNDPMDDNGHGTHIAGIIGAEINGQNKGIAGMSENVEIMAVKIGQSYGPMTNVLEGINFAKNNGAKIINASFGDNNISQDFLEDMLNEIQDFTNTGGLIVASAGNEEYDNEIVPRYPSNYSLDALVSVAATNQLDSIWSDSNWGEESVDVAAPGDNILSTYIDKKYPFDEDFESQSMQTFSKDPVNNNDWGVAHSGTTQSYAMSTNDSAPYGTGTYATVISDEIDLSNADEDSVNLSFWVWCDTEPIGQKVSAPDRLDIQIQSDTQQSPLSLDTIDETKLEKKITIGTSTGHYATKQYAIPSDYVADDTVIKFAWITDGDDAGGTYRGCMIDDVKITHINANEKGETEKYTYMSGTSMAAPHVAGLAAMIWAERPDLSAVQVKQRIMDTVDYIEDLDPEEDGGHPVKSGGRINAYKAMLSLDTYIPIVLEPTITAKSTGGNWNSYSTWVENDGLDCAVDTCVKPTVSDVVEINGTVNVQDDFTVKGVVVNEGAILQDYTNISGLYINEYTLTIEGDLLNNGNIRSYYLYSGGYRYNNNSFTLEVSGNIQNEGTMNRKNATYGNLYLKSGGDIMNNGTWIPTSTTLTGNDTRIINTTTDINSDVEIAGDFELQGEGVFLGGNFDLNSHTLTINTPHEPTFGGIASTSSGAIMGTGKLNITNDVKGYTSGSLPEIEIIGAGTLQATLNNFPKVIFSGSGYRNVYDTNISGDVEIGTGAILQDYTPSATDHSKEYTLTIEGDLLNHGTIQSYYSYVPYNAYYNESLTVEVLGDIQNEGTLKRKQATMGNLYLKSGGDITNNGVWTPTNTTLTGNDTRIINTTTDINSDVEIDGDFELRGNGVFSSGDFDLNSHTLTINTPHEPTFGGIASTSSGSIMGTGKVKITNDVKGYTSGSLPEIEIIGAGTLQATLNNFPKVIFSGSGYRNVYDTTISGNVEIGTGAILQDYTPSATDHSKEYTLTIEGDLLNHGTIQSYYSYVPYNAYYNESLTVEVLGDIQNEGTLKRKQATMGNLYLKSGGDITNNGVWTPTNTNLIWSTSSGATAYDFQMTDDNNAWQTPEVLTITSKTIANSYLDANKGYRWRTRVLVNDVYTDWSTTKAINEYQTTQLITASGSTVTLTNSNASVEFPENATSQDLQINITELDDTGELPPTETYYSLISTAYEFTATDLQGASVTFFDDDVIITLQYDPASLGDINPSNLKVNYYDEVNEVWVELPSVVDTVNYTVTAEVNHFTKFAVIGNIIHQITFEIEGAEGNPISGAQFSTDNKVTWQNFPTSFDLPYYTEPYDFKFGDYQFHHLFRFLVNNAYEVDLITGAFTSQASSGTTATFILDTVDTTLKVVDQDYVEIPDATVGINGIVDLYPNGSGFTLVNGVERQFTYSWRGEFYQPEFALEKGKINRWEGGTLTKIDSGSGTTQIEFVLPTVEVSVHTVNGSGAELTSGEVAVHSLGQSDLHPSGFTFSMPNGGSTHFYGWWNNNQTTILNLEINSGNLYQVDTESGTVAVSTTGSGTTRVEFVYDVIPVVVKTVDQTGQEIGGTVKIYSGDTSYYPSGKTYQLANGAQESFRGSFGGEYRYNDALNPLTIEEGKTYLIKGPTNIVITDSADGLTYVEIEFPVIGVVCRTIDQYGNHKGGGQFKFDNVWRGTGYTYTMSAGARKSFYARFDNTSNTVYKGFNVYKGKLHTVDSITKVLTVTNSPDGITRVEFVFPIVSVKVSTWDSTLTEVANALYSINTWTTWTGASKTLKLKKDTSASFYNNWNGTTFSRSFTPQESKIYEISSSGMTTTDAGTGITLSEVKFLHPNP